MEIGTKWLITKFDQSEMRIRPPGSEPGATFGITNRLSSFSRDSSPISIGTLQIPGNTNNRNGWIEDVF